MDISEFYYLGRLPPSWDGEDDVTLYSNPQSIERALSAIYGSTNGLLSTAANVTYGHSQRGPVKLSGSLIDTQSNEYDATQYLDKLEGLSRPSINSSPSVLAIVWGARVIQPVVLTELTINEIAWANGLVSKAEIGLSFVYLPPISYRSSNDEDRITALTDREKDKAKKLAAEQENKDKDKKHPKVDPKSLKVTDKGEVKDAKGKTILKTNREQLNRM